MKKLLVWCLTLAMVLSIVPAFGVTVTAATDFSDYIGISTADQLKAIEPGNNYYLQNDITVTGGWAPIELFHSGVLDGNGHKISGINLTNQCEGGEACSKAGGLFLALNHGAVIRNLTVQGTMTETKNGTHMAEIGGIVATVAGSDILFENVTNNVTITSLIDNGTVGGFIGCITTTADAVTEETDNASVTIRNCVNNATLSASCGRLGGFVGSSYGQSLTIADSVNNGSVNDALFVGGFIGMIDIVGDADSEAALNRTTTLTGCWNKGSVKTDLDTSKGWPSAGGFIGDTAWMKHNLTMTDCINLGRITCNNNGGGLMGSAKVQDKLTDGDYTMKRCYNYGTGIALASGGAAGFLKYVASCNMLFEDCINFASMTAAGGSCAGFIADTKNATLTFKNCLNYGDITLNETTRSKQTGGLLSNVQESGTVTLEYCANYGTVTANINGWTRIAGIIGSIADAATCTVRLNYCANYGELVAPKIEETASGHQPLVADMVASIGTNATVAINSCYGAGKATLPTFASGDSLPDNYIAAMFGRTSATTTMENCVTGYKLQEQTAFTTIGGLTGAQMLMPGDDNYSANQLLCSDLNEGCEEGKEVYTFDGDVVFITAYNQKPITMYGTQETAVNDGTFDVRLVAIVDSKDYAGAGIELTGIADGKGITKKSYDIKTVYEKINNGLLAPKGYYFVTLTIKGLSAEDTVTLMATPYVTTDDGNVMGAQATITYTNGVRG